MCHTHSLMVKLLVKVKEQNFSKWNCKKNKLNFLYNTSASPSIHHVHLKSLSNSLCEKPTSSGRQPLWRALFSRCRSAHLSDRHADPPTPSFSITRFFYHLFILCRLLSCLALVHRHFLSFPANTLQESPHVTAATSYRLHLIIFFTSLALPPALFHVLPLYRPNSLQAQIPKFTDVSKIKTKKKHYLQTGSVEQMFPYVHNLLVLLLRSLRLVWSVWICWARKSGLVWSGLPTPQHGRLCEETGLSSPDQHRRCVLSDLLSSSAVCL